MSKSRSWVTNQENVDAVLTAYLADDRPTVQDLADRLGTHYHNVLHVVREGLSSEQYSFEKSLRKSRSKMGESNPMAGKYGQLHHNYVGEVVTGDGYLQIKVKGRYELVHRMVMADMLGLERIPKTLEVHHIDGVKTNNDPDNLAVVTTGGHRQLHAESSLLSRSPLWVQYQHSISQSKTTSPT